MKKAAVPSILVVVVLLAVAVTAEAQQPKKVPRIGVLLMGNPTSESPRFEAIRQHLRELGYIEGQNIAIEYRYAEGKRDRLPELAAELVRLKIDVFVVSGGVQQVRAAMDATKTIPIVMVGQGSDPIAAGLIDSLARPGGNVTGITSLIPELGGKRLELLKDGRSQTCPCRGSLRIGQSAQCTPGERVSSTRGACAEVDDSVLGGTSCGRFRESLRCAKQGAPGWTLCYRRLANAC
jgi:hypothetical protein